MTRQEAINKTLEFVEPYVKGQALLNDAQAARIGRELFSNLRQADRDERKESVGPNA